MEKKKKNRMTIYDVASEAGVSPATVSRVISHKGQVAMQTRRRVLAAMERLGFVQPVLHEEEREIKSGMLDNLFQNSSIITFDYYDKRSEKPHQHSDVELFYVLGGHVDLLLEDEKIHLEADDFVVINPNTAHAFEASAEVLYVGMYIRYYELSRKVGRIPLAFACNTVHRTGADYEGLQILLKKIFNWQTLAKGVNSLYIESLYYMFLNQLVSRFTIDVRQPDVDGKLAEKIQLDEIKYYIQSNYREPVTLNKMAEALFLSPSYMSKYFKKHFGMSFSKYLCQIRLEHAVEDLKKADKSITRIAMDDGFPNTASFNQAFRARYGTTPSVFVEQWRREHPLLYTKKAADAVLALRVQDYLKQHQQEQNLSVTVEADANRRQQYTKYWNKMINVGRSDALFNAEMREQLILMKKELGFQYIRFWDLYEPITFLSHEQKQDKYNFTKLDRLFDFLIENNMLPFIELGFKPVLLLRLADGGHHFLVSQQKEILFKTTSDYERFIFAFAKHYSERYGVDVLERWYFEQWIDPRQVNKTDWSGYFDIFEAAYRGLKRISQNIRLGGGGISVTDSDYKSLLHGWYKRSYHPDFFSVYCYPYTAVIRGEVHQSPLKQVEAFNKAAVNAGFNGTEVFLTEWNFTVSDRNPLNDRCFKGAYIVQNVLECINQLDIMGYWYASDLLTEYIDTEFILNGGNGLVSRDGLKKPAYYAFALLGRLGKYLLHKNSESAVTISEQNDYSMICHNFKRPSLKYILKAEDNQEISGHSDDYESNDEKQFRFRITNVKNGIYTVKTHSVSNINGSIHSEWEQMGFPAKVSKSEIDYLKHICVPRIRIAACEVKDNVLSIETVLAPQEVQYLHITLAEE